MLWLYIEQLAPEGTITIGKVTEAGTMLSEVEVTTNYTDKDGNALTGTIIWYQWSEEDDGCWKTIDNPETYEVAEGVEYSCEFWPDNTDYSTLANNVVLWPAHEWAYTANGTTLTATCSKHENCTVVMEIEVDERLYVGEYVENYPQGAAVVVVSDNDAVNEIEIPKIVYEKQNGTTWEAITGAPINAGTYRAGFTLGDATAYVEYTIRKAGFSATITFKASVTYNEGKAVDVVEEICVPDGAMVYFSTSTDNSIMILFSLHPILMATVSMPVTADWREMSFMSGQRLC